MTSGKVLTLEQMTAVRENLRNSGQSLVFTNGCFDLLHPGHVRYLEAASALGDRLLVAVNDDGTVSRLKGRSRPLVPLADRMEVLAALGAVSYVVSFDEDTPARLIRQLVPDVLVKGGDWAIEDIVGRDTVEEAGGRVLSLAYAAGYSTTSLLTRIRQKLNSS